MGFKKTAPPVVVPDSPEKLILDLPRRKIKGVLLHQGEMMKNYVASALNKPDVALQLPTGSGKTLVGLMIAEWRRRKFQEKVVYLCPTRQLVNQVVEQAQDKYGLTVLGFTGPASGYDPIAKSKYNNADHVAVTTYNSLFNTNPFFNNPQIIVIDDAHAAENYIASMWALKVSRFDHATLHTALTNLLKPYLGHTEYTRLCGTWSDIEDATWVDKLPTPDFMSIHDEFVSLVDTHVTPGSDISHPWRLLREHLSACQLYLSSQDILLRPLIPPTWSHAPFIGAKQRIYMSATLGAGGDLERLTGRSIIERIPVPGDWEKQGIGRRYFMFPGMSLHEEEIAELRTKLMQMAGRSLVLVPSDKAQKGIVDEVREQLAFKTYNADDIEGSKRDFIQSPKAVAVVANRYDGIDFPGDDCRLLFIDGLPRAMNSQERFLMTRMGANVLYNERVQTRVLQAIGRCTRSLEDFSAVVVTGDDIPNYLTERTRRSYLHPELQAELEFGIEQSQEMTIEDFIENLGIFLNNDLDWEEANNQILVTREKAVQKPFPAMGELQQAVRHEIEFQKALWQADYEAALAAAEKVITVLTSPDLQGYRALWYYLAGSAAWLGEQNRQGLLSKAREHYRFAKKAAPNVPWLVKLSKFQPEQSDSNINEKSQIALAQIERVEAVLEKLGTHHDLEFNKKEKRILAGLESTSTKPGPFESAHVELGEMLGFVAGKKEEDASPDPWWIAGKICFVFEDHAGAQSTSSLDATKARQAATHPNWIRANVPIDENAEIIPVLVSPVGSASTGALPHLNGVLLWPLDEFKTWAKEALAALRELRRTFTEPGNLIWRADAIEVFEKQYLDAGTLHDKLKKNVAAKVLQSRLS